MATNREYCIEKALDSIRKDQPVRFASLHWHIPARDPPATVGKNWSYNFLRRYPDLKHKPSKLLSHLMAQYATKSNVVNWFDLLKGFLDKYHIKNCNVINMDKDGVQEGETKSDWIIGTALTKRS